MRSTSSPVIGHDVVAIFCSIGASGSGALPDESLVGVVLTTVAALVMPALGRSKPRPGSAPLVARPDYLSVGPANRAEGLVHPTGATPSPSELQPICAR
jgi:hypothetical protein